MNYGEEIQKSLASTMGGCIEMPRLTLTERLRQERAKLMSRVEELDSVIAALEANPAVQSVLDLLQKTRCL